MGSKKGICKPKVFLLLSYYLWWVSRMSVGSHVIMESNVDQKPMTDNHQQYCHPRAFVPPIRQPNPVCNSYY